jgi:integrase
MISQGVDIATVSKRLGHADINITLKRYVHALKEYDREAVDKLVSLLFKSAKEDK